MSQSKLGMRSKELLQSSRAGLLQGTDLGKDTKNLSVLHNFKKWDFAFNSDPELIVSCDWEYLKDRLAKIDQAVWVFSCVTPVFARNTAVSHTCRLYCLLLTVVSTFKNLTGWQTTFISRANLSKHCFKCKSSIFNIF